MKKINILLGNYGSGKTEISLNLVKKIKGSGEDVVLIDLDIVNPYFRSSEHKEMLNDLGIELISPTFANTAVDLPTLSPMVYSMTNTKKHVVIDCGGDPAGATALGFLSDRFNKAKDDIDVFFVINTCRPLQSEAKSIIEMMDSIEHVSKLKINKLIINSNLSIETDYTMLEQGLIIGKQVAQQKNIDIAYVCGTEKVLDNFRLNTNHPSLPSLKIEIFTRPQWLNQK